MPKCSVLRCGARKSSNQPLSLHRLPSCKTRRKQWLDIIGEENINPSVRVTYICSLHFEESSFNRTLNKIILRDDALPSQRLFAIRENIPTVSAESIQSASELATNVPETDELTDDEMLSATTPGPSTVSTIKPFQFVNIVGDKGIETVSGTESIHCSPKTSNLSSRQKVENMKRKCEFYRKKIKRLNEKIRRQNNKIADCQSIIKELQEKKINDDCSIVLDECAASKKYLIIKSKKPNIKVKNFDFDQIIFQ